MTSTNSRFQKINGGAESLPAPVSKNWWESQGFLVSVLMVAGSTYGLSESDAQNLVAGIVGAASSIVFVFQFFKTSKFKGWLQVIKDGNSLQYFVGALSFIVPNLGTIVPALQGLIDAIWSKNLGLILSAAVSFAVAVYNIIKTVGGNSLPVEKT